MIHQVRYKLCTQENTTHDGFQLPAIGVWYSAADINSPPKPCTNTVLHHYKHPLLAVLFNPIHANIHKPKCYKITISKELGTDGLKGWSRKQKLLEQIELPYISINAKIAFAILCGKQVYKDIAWNVWANNWLSGKDRSQAAADAAAYAAAAAANAAAAATAAAAADATAAKVDLLTVAKLAIKLYN